MKELRDVIAGVQRAAAAGEPMSLATVVRIEGSAYRRPGARLLIGPEGARVGSISGGCLEADVICQAAAAWRTRAPRLVRYDLRGSEDIVFGFGLGCDGAVEVLVEPLPRGEVPRWMADVGLLLADRKPAVLATALADSPDGGLRLAERRLLRVGAPAPSPACALEPIEPPPALWIFGAGEDTRALASLGHDLGFLVAVVDPSSSRASRERFPRVDRFERRHPGDSLADLPIDARTAVVLMTHRYESDREWLAALATRPAGYVGVLGPRRRTERLRAELARRGVVVGRLFAPAGLDIGAEGPGEIALAILAEITAVLSGREGGHLRDHQGPLHEAVESEVLPATGTDGPWPGAPIESRG